jgi:hypothetical protein
MGIFFSNHTDIFIFEKGRFRDCSLDKQIMHEFLPSCDRHIWQQLLQENEEVKCGHDGSVWGLKLLYAALRRRCDGKGTQEADACRP